MDWQRWNVIEILHEQVDCKWKPIGYGLPEATFWRPYYSRTFRIGIIIIKMSKHRFGEAGKLWKQAAALLWSIGTRSWMSLLELDFTSDPTSISMKPIAIWCAHAQRMASKSYTPSLRYGKFLSAKPTVRMVRNWFELDYGKRRFPMERELRLWDDLLSMNYK